MSADESTLVSGAEDGEIIAWEVEDDDDCETEENEEKEDIVLCRFK